MIILSFYVILIDRCNFLLCVFILRKQNYDKLWIIPRPHGQEEVEVEFKNESACF